MEQQILSPVIIPVSLEKMAYDAIKEAIFTFRFQPGQSLVENDLAKQLNISKTPVRESLTRLEREGFIIKIPYKGYFVSEISHQGMLDIFEIRAVLEGLAVRHATLALTEEEIKEADLFVAQQRDAAEASNIQLASQLNRKFHDLLIFRAGNERLTLILANLDDHLRRYRTLSNYQSGRLTKSVAEHRDIVEAIKKRDPLLAEGATRKHILSVSEDLSKEKFEELIDKITLQK